MSSGYTDDMGRTIEELYDHEGYAARKLPDGTLTGTWSAATKEFLAFVPACSCGGPGHWSEWYGSTEYPPTDEGEEAAIEEWERLHAWPLLGSSPVWLVPSPYRMVLASASVG